MGAGHVRPSASACTAAVDQTPPPVSLSNFKLGRSIGRGAFGRVKVVVMRSNGVVYALKYIDKDQCVAKRAHRSILRERAIMEHLEHAFIVNLRYAFQDDFNLYFVLDLMLGGDLRFHLSRLLTLPENYVVFFAAELVSAIAYLHVRGVVHRDIKPDNILLNSRGHAHLSDFNCATVFECGKPLYTKTGTPGYMAPEIYAGGGYDSSIDWWSLGIVLYELLHGRRPFVGSQMDRLVARIQGTQQKYDSQRLSRTMMSFIDKLLQKSPAQRTNNRGSDCYKSVIAHPIFAKIDWKSLSGKFLDPPYVPDISGINFDNRYELEEVLLDNNQLFRRRGRQRRAAATAAASKLKGGEDGGNVRPELDQLVKEFRNYDFVVAGVAAAASDGSMAAPDQPNPCHYNRHDSNGHPRPNQSRDRDDNLQKHGPQEQHQQQHHHSKLEPVELGKYQKAKLPIKLAIPADFEAEPPKKALGRELVITAAAVPLSQRRTKSLGDDNQGHNASPRSRIRLQDLICVHMGHFSWSYNDRDECLPAPAGNNRVPIGYSGAREPALFAALGAQLANGGKRSTNAPVKLPKDSPIPLAAYAQVRSPPLPQRVIVCPPTAIPSARKKGISLSIHRQLLHKMDNLPSTKNISNLPKLAEELLRIFNEDQNAWQQNPNQKIQQGPVQLAQQEQQQQRNY